MIWKIILHAVSWTFFCIDSTQGLVGIFKPTAAPTLKPTAAPTPKPTAAPTSKPTTAPTSGITTIAYNGNVYSTVANVPIGGSSLLCQSTWLAMPLGWAIAPDNADTVALSKLYSFSTHVIVVESGVGYCTTQLYCTGVPFGDSQGKYQQIDNLYRCPWCSYQILTISTAPTQKTKENNGAVSCQTYCAGRMGQSWNNELPYSWNGAKCISTNIPSRDCNAVAGNPIICYCTPTGMGWAGLSSMPTSLPSVSPFRYSVSHIF